jgi:hypothetical protein
MQTSIALVGTPPPVNTVGCKVTGGGRITAHNGDKATFGGNAQAVSSTSAMGQEEYQDQGPAQPMNVHSLSVLTVSCSSDGRQASILGLAQVDGAGVFPYRIDVKDLGKSGTNDTYRIRVNGYDSGEQTLQGGNIDIHLP